MIDYCTSSDAVNGMIFLSAWNSPPKYGFNRCVVTVNVPFSGCVTSAPPFEKTLVTMKGPDDGLQFPRKKFQTGIKQEDLLPLLEFLHGNVFIMPGLCLFLVNVSIFISFVPEFV